MNVEDLPLPYPYSHNSRGGSTKTLVLCFLLSGLLLVGYFISDALAWWVPTLPILGAAARALLFRTIRNAVHEAMRMAQADARLDAYIFGTMMEAAREGLTEEAVQEELNENAKRWVH